MYTVHTVGCAVNFIIYVHVCTHQEAMKCLITKLHVCTLTITMHTHTKSTHMEQAV